MKKFFRHRVLIPSGDRVPLVGHTHFITHENGSLTIIGVSDMDSGPFVCWARNRLGSDLAYTHLYNSHPGNGARKFESQNFIFLMVIFVVCRWYRTPSHLPLDPSPRGLPPTQSHPHLLTPPLPRPRLSSSRHLVVLPPPLTLSPSLISPPLTLTLHLPALEWDPGI